MKPYGTDTAPPADRPPEPSRELLEIGGGLLYRTGEVRSALDSSWELLGKDLFPELSSLFAESQTGGRGRYGRTWASPPGHVYASMRLPLRPPFEGSAAPAAMAAMLALALEEETGTRILIKWPNDLILDGRKAGGILLENRRGALMAGIGLNVGRPPDLSEEDGGRDPSAPPPGALPEDSAGSGGPFGLWKRLAKNVIARYNAGSALLPPAARAPSGRAPVPDRGPGRNPCAPVLRTGFPDLMDAAASRLYGMGRRVLVKRPAPAASEGELALEGRIAGLDAGGALVVETSRGPRSLWSGTVLFPPD
ncbi:MAG: hypothetical protein LBQ79_13160 [Deltaproteobacteria bacterium]|jgi:biotin-(acetyl-CoA carboxylase) ligase|nr:hypothetical protein [Deltaproteobacteria bacterium]